MDKKCNGCGEIKAAELFETRRGTCRKCVNNQKRVSDAKRIAGLPAKQCPSCLNSFHTEAKPGKYNRGTYCSPACRSAGERATRVHKECGQCGKPFWHWPAHDQKYCAKACYTEAMKGRIAVACEQCGKETLKKPCDIKRMRHQFCTPECSKAFKTGVNHPMYLHGRTKYIRGRGWPTIRKRILERDKHTCQRCRTHKDNLTKKQWRFEIHHITPFAFFMSDELANHPSNLITYCHTCHWIVERQSKPKRAKRQMLLFAA